MTNICLAYKFVATAAMLAEINHAASNLQLKVELPIRPGDARIRVLDRFEDEGLIARIDAGSYTFSFFGSEQLRFVSKLDSMGRQAYGITRGRWESRPELFERLSHLSSIVNSNDVYKLATNWLNVAEVDVVKLEKENLLTIIQSSLCTKDRGLVMCPVFYLYWGDIRNSTVNMIVSGVTAELQDLRQERLSYSKRPRLIKDEGSLLSIRDSEFSKYAALERSNLVVRFAVNPQAANCIFDDLSPPQIKTNTVSPMQR